MYICISPAAPGNQTSEVEGRTGYVFLPEIGIKSLRVYTSKNVKNCVLFRLRALLAALHAMSKAEFIRNVSAQACAKSAENCFLLANLY